MVVPIVLSYHASQNGVGYSRAGVRRGWKSNFQEVVWERVSLQEVYGMENSNPTRKRYTFYKKPIETGRCMYCPLLIVYVKYNVTYFCGDVYFCWVRYIAAYWKSSNTFCLFPKQPAWCHVSPYSLERKTEGIELPWKKNPHWITQGDLHQVWAPLCICTGRQVPCRSWNKPLLYSI